MNLRWLDLRVGLPTVLMLLAVVAAGSFAAGRAVPTSAASSPARAPGDTNLEAPDEATPEVPPGTEPPGAQLPPGHPAIDPTEATADPAGEGEQELEWTPPARWESVQNPSNMRLATYRIRRAAGDMEDAELSVSRAGGTPEANAERWVKQFDAAAQKTAKITSRTVGPLRVTEAEVQGTYLGGMDADAGARSGWSLVGAIVPVGDAPYFFKLSGPKKTVAAARAEFEAMIQGLKARP